MNSLLHEETNGTSVARMLSCGQDLPFLFARHEASLHTNPRVTGYSEDLTRSRTTSSFSVGIDIAFNRHG
jgi:hypothetical protein